MSDIESIVIYIIVGAVALLFSRVSERSGSPWGLFFAVLVLSLASGLRDYSVGIDTSRYQLAVEHFYATGELYWPVTFAYGYGYFTSFFLHIWNNYSFLLFVQAFITNGLILARFWDFRNGASLTFMVFAYLCTGYLTTLNIICQYLAVAIVFYSTRFLDKGKLLWFVIGVCLAASLHNSAVVAMLMILPYVIRFKGISTGRKFAQVLICVAFVVAVFFGYRFLINRYGSYLSSSDGISFGMMTFAQLLVFFFSLLAAGYFSKGDDGGRGPLRSTLDGNAPHSVFFYLLYMLFTLAAYVIDPAGRVSYYFLMYGAPVFGGIAHRSRVSKACFYVAGLLILWFIFYAGYSNFFNDSGGILPYSFVWMGA